MLHRLGTVRAAAQSQVIHSQVIHSPQARKDSTRGSLQRAHLNFTITRVPRVTRVL